MGMYDSFYDKNGKEYQLKNGECCLNEYNIGDFVAADGYDDGIYFCDTYGCIVVYNGIFVAVIEKDQLQDKWGNKIDYMRAKECTN